MTSGTATARRPLLALKHITKRFGGITALRDISIDVCAGEVVALVGDNGAGKSTLVKTIAGINQQDHGSIEFEDREVTLNRPQEASQLGIQTVYQDLALCDNLDTVQNLFLGRELYSSFFAGRRLRRAQMEDRAREVLRGLNVKIRDYSAPVLSLSGGQRQSVAVARAVLSDPKVVLLDEPTAALGVPQRAEVLGLIHRLREQGRGVILISHDLGDVLEVADRVVVLRLGEKVAEFTRETVTRDGLVAAITGINDSSAANPRGGQGAPV